MNVLKKPSYIVNIQIAHLSCQIKIDKKDCYQYILKNYRTVKLKLSKNPWFKISLQMRDDGPYGLKVIDKKSNRFGVVYYNKIYGEKEYFSFFLRECLDYLAIQNNILFLHASAIEKNNKAYVFCGKSGIGKSTIIRNCPKEYILGDDTVILRKINDRFYIYTSPFDNLKYPNLKHRKILLNNIYFLKQSKGDKLVNLEKILSFKMILANIKFHEHFQEEFKKFRKPLIINNHKIEIRKQVFDKVSYDFCKLAFDLVSYCQPQLLCFKKNTKFVKNLDKLYG